MKKQILAGALALSTLLGSTDLYARRRAVGREDPARANLSHIMTNVQADEDPRYTNLGTAPSTVKTCIENTKTCVEDTLQPGQSVTKNDLVRSLGRESANLEVFSPQPTEVRAKHDAIPTSLATTSRQNIPLMTANQVLQIYSMGNGSAELITRGYNGVQKDIKTIDLAAGTNTITLTGIPGSLGDQYDLIPTVRTIATSVVEGVQHRAKSLEEATGRQFLVRANDGTFAFVKNADPTSILSLTSIRYTPDATGTYANHFDALNWGVKYVNDITNGVVGSVDIHGNRINNVEQPFLGWSKTPFQSDGATSNTRFVIDKRFNLSLNQLPTDGVLSLYAAQTDANYTVNAINDDGTRAGTTSGTLLPNQSIDLDIRGLGGTRLEVVVADRTDNVAGNPNLLLSANVNGVVKTGYRVEKPFSGTTGKEYVDTWFKPLEGKIFYLNNREFRCMINGSCGVRSYAPDLAEALYPTSNYPGTVKDFEQFIRQMVDGNFTNGELIGTKDPMQVSTQTIGRYQSLFLHPNDGIIKSDMNETTSRAVFNVYGAFLENFTQTHPGEYGGTTATGPNKGVSPTWDTRDPNNPAGYTSF